MTVLLDSQTTCEMIDPDRIRETADRLLAWTGWTEAELSILLVDDSRITELNAAYRRKDKPTNVLSFPMLDPEEQQTPTLLGDIVISAQTAAREAAEQRVGAGDYLIVLLVHGFIHLLGYDHERGEQAAEEMVMEERKLLEKLGKDGLLDQEVESLISFSGV